MVVCPKCENHFHRWGHQSSFDAPSLAHMLRQAFGHVRVEERFFSDWEEASWARRGAGLVKRLLSNLKVGPYGVARNLFFEARA